MVASVKSSARLPVLNVAENFTLPPSVFASPLSVMDFMKHSTHLNYDQGALKKAQDSLQTLTEMEGFTAHYNAVQQRLNQSE